VSARLFLKNFKKVLHQWDSWAKISSSGATLKDIWNIRVAKLRLAVQTVEKNRLETEMPDHGGLYEVSDYTQLGKSTV